MEQRSKQQLWELIERVDELLDTISQIKTDARSMLEDFDEKPKELINDYLNSPVENGYIELLRDTLRKTHSGVLLKDIHDGEPIPEYLLKNNQASTAIAEVMSYMSGGITAHLKSVQHIRDSGGKLEFRFSSIDRDVDQLSEGGMVYWVGGWQLRGGDEVPDAREVIGTLSSCRVIRDMGVTCKVTDINNLLVMVAKIRISKVWEMWLKLHDLV